MCFYLLNEKLQFIEALYAIGRLNKKILKHADLPHVRLELETKLVLYVQHRIMPFCGCLNTNIQLVQPLFTGSL